MSNQFNEPWEIRIAHPAEMWNVVGADGSSEFTENDPPTMDVLEQIVACVNACAGIDDPAALRRQRDELLASCKMADAELMNAVGEVSTNRTALRIAIIREKLASVIAAAEGTK